ncbi:fungal-specific transcription factor domain-containing protein [Apodospora peruviana]|uniref:Fungal-specific transcription factor domain-containing protein n=1 Tax=Apodospora peruviana TaxID=516989 RepID=A0AAE0M535_9PEZI|nr:fungal-specific transcription factor domain-containing protein [Apodospora peruviana]
MGSGSIVSLQPRQQPGCACEQCRKRKLRCDRQRPQCGTCAEAGIVCEVNSNRQARGPKKGDLKALRTRIVALERRLSLDQTTEFLVGGGGNFDSSVCYGETTAIIRPGTAAAAASESASSTAAFGHQRAISQLPAPYDNNGSADWENEIHVQLDSSPITPKPAPTLPPFKFPPSPVSSPPKHAAAASSVLIHDLMRADLDQLYFDRVHPNVPIFNQSRYFARSRQLAQPETGNNSNDNNPPIHQQCLQYAMWTLAMALSSQFESFRDGLYTETKQMLEALEDSNDNDNVGDLDVRIEQVQAWLLVAFYEFTRTNYRRGWISAGRAFRFVQLAGLHALDSPDSNNMFSRHQAGEDDDAVGVLIEERRRTFWVAYCLDRFISVHKGGQWPMTLTEEAICTRLPSPERAFQSGHPISGSFLPEAIASSDRTLPSPLAECAILATICGRGLSHCQTSRVERASSYGSPSMDFWLRHEWLEGMLARRLDTLATSYPAAADPMLLFTFMMAQATVVNLSNILLETTMNHTMMMTMMSTESQQQSSVSYGLVVEESRTRAMQAARDIARLVKAHEQIGYFKAHIFLPLAVFIGASYLQHVGNETTSSTTTSGGSIMDEIEVGGSSSSSTGSTHVFHGDMMNGRRGSAGQSGVVIGMGTMIGNNDKKEQQQALRSCVDALRKMQSFNNLARDHLSVLESSQSAEEFMIH